MKRYSHNQIGYLMILTIVGAIFIIALSAIQSSETALLGLILVMIAVLTLFYSLTVSIDDEKLEVKFGLGIIRKSFPIKMIISCRAVKNPWYYGWGIRYIPGGWLFNVSGYDAIEIIMNNKKRYRIGTDDSEELEKIINDIINQNGNS